MQVCTFRTLAREILAAPPRLGPVRMVAVDGPAGSGKTTFASRLSRAFDAPVPVVHTDDLLEGWTDLTTFWSRLQCWILDPLRHGAPGKYRRYDWHEDRFSDGWIKVPLAPAFILEGVTSARAEVRRELTLGVFVTVPDDLRLARGLERDGAELREHWRRWMADERRHFAADRTVEQVRLVVDGAPTIAHDPEREFVTRNPNEHRGALA